MFHAYQGAQALNQLFGFHRALFCSVATESFQVKECGAVIQFTAKSGYAGLSERPRPAPETFGDPFGEIPA